MEVKYPNCAGIDIAKNEHWVALPADVERQHRVRVFGGYTQDLQSLSSWLRQNNIEQVAMEATGVYWIAPYELLDRAEFDVCLVNPLQTKRRDQRKSDALGCQWIQQLMSYGLLNASYRPQDQVCELRWWAIGEANICSTCAVRWKVIVISACSGGKPKSRSTAW